MVNAIFLMTCFVSGCSDAVPPSPPVQLLAQPQVPAPATGHGGPRHCATAALRARDPSRVRYVRHQDQLRF